MGFSINLNALHWEHHFLAFQSMLQLDMSKPCRWNYRTWEVGSPALRICELQIRLPEVLRQSTTFYYLSLTTNGPDILTQPINSNYSMKAII